MLNKWKLFIIRIIVMCNQRFLFDPINVVHNNIKS